MSSLFALARYLADERPHVVLSTSIPANALWGRVWSQTRTPIVITANLNLTKATAKWGGLIAKLLRWLIARAYNGAQAVIAISRGVAEDLITVTGIPGERVFQIYNPLDLELVARLSRETVEHPWLSTLVRPLSCSRSANLNCRRIILRSFGPLRACRRKRKAHLVILGEGEERARIERLVKILGIEADVYLPGFVENPFAWMARVSVFVLASAWEGLSNVLLEALACGCTVVSTDCPSGPREILADGKFGYLVPVGNDAALADAILAALSAPSSA